MMIDNTKITGANAKSPGRPIGSKLLIALLFPFLASGQIHKDKVYHAIAGTLASSGTTFVCYKLGVKKLPSLAIGFGVGVAVGIAKELIWDKAMGKGNPTAADALWTSAGAAFGTVTMTFAIKSKKR